MLRILIEDYWLYKTPHRIWMFYTKNVTRILRVPNLLGIRLFALLLAQNSVATNAMFDNRGTAILLAVRLVFCSAISKK